MIKYVASSWQVEHVFDDGASTKLAAYEPETFIPKDIEIAISSLREKKPDPRFVYVHLIAMTDGDFYGSNLNGDIFDTDELTGVQSEEESKKNKGHLKGLRVPRYKTFETAKFFRNHANSDHDAHYGDVEAAGWNDFMRRVELLVRIAKERVPELKMESGAPIVAKLEKRGYIQVSMGTKISHEICSICNHSNELTIDRCDHLKHMMNEVMPDGRKVAARNYGMQFFDISDVNVPADPGAWSMLKVASASANPNAALDDAPSRRFKSSEMEKHTPAASDPLRDLDARFADGKTPVTADAPPAYTTEELAAALQKCASVDVVLSTAAAAGIVFSPVELATLTALAEPAKLASDAFEGFGRISLDLFYAPVYDVLRSKTAARSGFCAPLLVTGWEPSKVAEQGATSLAQYYTAYRNALSSLSQASFSKTAQRTGALRDLVVDGDVKRAMYHLTFAGLLAPTTP